MVLIINGLCFILRKEKLERHLFYINWLVLTRFQNKNQILSQMHEILIWALL